MGYYDGTKLLSLKDVNGLTPEIYMCCTNRTAGKTTYFNRLVLNHVKKKKTKFMLLYRYVYELEDIPQAFFKDVGELFFPNCEFSSEKRRKGVYYDLFFNGEHCGYATCLNYAEQIKKISHTFSDVDEQLMDEFQSESNKYCTNEIQKFHSIHTSVARGHGKQTRRVPVYLIGNAVTVLNPYYSTFGVADKLRNETKFLRGEGWVLESSVNDDAKESMQNSAFNRAFGKNKSVAYSAENIYLNDNYSFVEKMSGRARYVATLIYKGNKYAVREFERQGIIYVDNKVDTTYPTVLCVTTEDHNLNRVMLKNNSLLISSLRQLFQAGCFRFKNLECKSAILKALSY